MIKMVYNSFSLGTLCKLVNRKTCCTSSQNQNLPYLKLKVFFFKDQIFKLFVICLNSRFRLFFDIEFTQFEVKDFFLGDQITQLFLFDVSCAPGKVSLRTEAPLYPS